MECPAPDMWTVVVDSMVVESPDLDTPWTASPASPGAADFPVGPLRMPLG